MPVSSPEELLSPAQTADYVPTGYWSWGLMWRFPRFTLIHVPRMMAEPRVALGLHLIKGPVISISRFYVRTSNEHIRSFVQDAFSRFWREGAIKALKAIEWGYSCSEVLYKLDSKGRITYGSLKDLQSIDCRCFVKDGKFHKASVKGMRGGGELSSSRVAIELYGMKAFWHVHQREHNQWYGRSRLFGAFMPFMEFTSDGGYRDTRRLWFHKNAYDGGIMYHPLGNIKVHGNPLREINAKSYAQQIMVQKKTGGILYLPNTRDETGNRLWEYIPPSPNPTPEGIMEYGNKLADEILEGMGIPPEMARPEATGPMGGGNGRGVAQEAFYCILQSIVNDITSDFDHQILRPLVRYAFRNDDYEIIPWSLTELLDRRGMIQSQPGQYPEAPSIATSAPPLPTSYQDQEGMAWAGSIFLEPAALTPYRGWQAAWDPSQPRAPKGGITLDGIRYKAGEWIPVEKHSKSAQEKLRQAIKKTISTAPKGKEAKYEIGKLKADWSNAEFVEAVYFKRKRGKREKGWNLASGKAWPSHVPRNIPPGTNNLVVNLKKGDVLAHGYSANTGNRYILFSDDFIKRSRERITRRVNVLRHKLPGILDSLREKASKDDRAAISLIMATMAVRIGYEDPSGKNKVYGARTLLAKHVIVSKPSPRNPTGVKLEFVGKRKIKHSHAVFDTKLAEILKKKARKLDPNDRLFPGVSYDSMLEYVRGLGGFDPHDFRRALSTLLAVHYMNELQEDSMPTTLKEARLIIRRICENVAYVLGNKPAECYKSYIDPAVFQYLFPAEGFPPELANKERVLEDEG